MIGSIVIRIAAKRHVATVVLLSRKNSYDIIEIALDLDEFDITSAESKATYEEIKDYVQKNRLEGIKFVYFTGQKKIGFRGWNKL